MSSSSPFVTTQWLADNLSAPDLVVVDASWHMPNTGRSGAAEFETAHIPGAVYFDMDKVADHSSGLPHMLPDADTFARAAGALGIGDGQRIVVYDTSGLFAAPRVWWTFKAFGAKDVFVLEGGLPRWTAEGRPTESGPSQRTPATFTGHLDAALVADADRVAAALAEGHIQVLDARPADRFLGRVPEPRPGLPSGHMPGSLNLHYAKVIRDGALIPEAEVKALLAEAGVDTERPVITSCGSGVTAAILWMALEKAGIKPQALYDGSWSEWGASGRPIATEAK